MKTTNINNTVIEQVTKPELLQVLEEKLKLGVAHFVFNKKDGSRREAFGTVSAAWFAKLSPNNPVQQSTGTSEKKEGITVYFDIEAMGWRSLINDNLIIVYSAETIKAERPEQTAFDKRLHDPID